jgi:hypothetical protein
MTDRVDPSQYGFTGGLEDGVAFLPDSGIEAVQPQTAPDGVYATPDELTRHPDHANPQDLMSVYPRDFFVQAPTPTRETGQPFPFQTSTPVYFADGYLAGVNVRETTGVSTALVNLRDGGDVGGNIVASSSLAPAESARDWLLPGGIPFSRGLYIEIATGTATGIAYVSRTVLV